MQLVNARVCEAYDIIQLRLHSPGSKQAILWMCYCLRSDQIQIKFSKAHDPMSIGCLLQVRLLWTSYCELAIFLRDCIAVC